MTHVATLIAPTAALDAATIARVRQALPGAAEPRWLAEGVAADISFTASAGVDQRANALRELSDRLRALLGDGVDVVVQPQAHRRKKLFLADMDSTMIGQECIDELAATVGLKAHVAAITERAMRGDVAFEPALRERVALLKGLSAKTIDEVIDKRISLTPGGRTLVATMRANGAFTCMVTGGFTLFTARIAAMIGFDETRANTLVIEDGKLAGTVAEPVFGRDGKRATLVELRARLGLAPHETLAIGDGANDIDMIAEAGLGVAFHAKPKVAQAAPARIDHADLTALLYVQGYRKDEFVLSDPSP
jgi:phosphoserine phosphatase